MMNNWNICGWRTVEKPSNIASVAISMTKGIVDIARQLVEATKTESFDALTNGSKRGSTGRDPKAKAINGKESNKGNACSLDRRARIAAKAASTRSQMLPAPTRARRLQSAGLRRCEGPRNKSRKRIE